jgi:hypothetical protein
MTLIDVVYQSLIWFTSIFTGVLLFSYAAFKLKNRGRVLVPYLGETQNNRKKKTIFQADRQFMNTSVYSQSGIAPKGAYNPPKSKNSALRTQNKDNVNREPNRFTRVETLAQTNLSSNKSHNRGGDKDYSSRKISNFYNDHAHKGNFSLASANVLNYYDDKSENEFYLFKTKF